VSVCDEEWTIVLFATRGLGAFLENALIGIERCGIDASLVQVILPANAECELRNLIKIFGARPRILEQLVEAGTGDIPTAYLEFGTHEFNQLMKCRFSAIRAILEEGKRLVYADIDVAWLRNPLPYLFDVLNHYPWACQTEAYPIFPPMFCLGFYAVSATRETLELMSHVIAGMDPLKQSDQDVFNKILVENRKYLASIFPLPEGLFPNGLLYRAVDRDKEPPVVMSEQLRPFIFHANCTAGLENKLRLLDHVGARIGSGNGRGSWSVDIGDPIPLYSMPDYQVHNTAQVRSGPNLQIITPSQKWSYALSFSVNPATARSICPSQQVRVFMKIRVEKGCIGLGVLQTGGDEFQIEKVIPSGRENLDLTLSVASAVDCGNLMIRNCSESGEPSRVSVLSIETRVSERGY